MHRIGLHRGPRRQETDKAIHPAGRAGPGSASGQAGFEIILAFEMRADLQGRSNGLHQCCVPGEEHVAELRHRGVERIFRCEGKQQILGKCKPCPE